MAFGPETDVSIPIWRGANRLDSLPTQKGVVSDKGCNFTTTDRKANCCIDEVGEECNAVLKVVPRYLHNTGRVLDNGDFRREEHFGRAIHQTILWDNSVRVDD